MSDTFKVGDTVVRQRGGQARYTVRAVRGEHFWAEREGAPASIGVILRGSEWVKVAPLFELGIFRHKTDGVLYKVIHLLYGGKQAVVLWANTLTDQQSVAIASDPEDYTKID